MDNHSDDSDREHAFLIASIEQMPGIVFLKSPDGLYKACNTGFCRVLGIDKNKIIGQSDTQLPWKVNAVTMQNNDKQVMSSLLEETFVEQFVHNSSLLLVLEIKKKCLIDSMNRCVGILGNGIDVTQQYCQPNNDPASHIMAQQVQEITGSLPDKNQSIAYYAQTMRSYLENIINSMPGNVYWMNTNSTFLGCNDNVLKLMGLSREEYVGKSYDDLIHMGIWTADQVASIKADDMQVVQTGLPLCDKEEPPLPSPDGDLIHYITSRVPIKNKCNKVIGIVGISIDITSRKKMEEELRNAKIAESVSRTKTEFIVNMSHDIRTPLTGIIGLSRYLEEEIQDAEAKEYAKQIHQSGEQLLGLLNGVLDMISADST